MVDGMGRACNMEARNAYRLSEGKQEEINHQEDKYVDG
jgi:hypothetical protein